MRIQRNEKTCVVNLEAPGGRGFHIALRERNLRGSGHQLQNLSSESTKPKKRGSTGELRRAVESDSSVAASTATLSQHSSHSVTPSARPSLPPRAPSLGPSRAEQGLLCHGQETMVSTEAPALRGSHTMCTLNICKLDSACAVMSCRGRDRGREGRRRRGGKGHGGGGSALSAVRAHGPRCPREEGHEFTAPPGCHCPGLPGVSVSLGP